MAPVSLLHWYWHFWVALSYTVIRRDLKMVFKKVKVFVLLLSVGLLSACASPAASIPALQATEAAAPVSSSPQATEAATNAATATKLPAPTVESSPTSQPAAEVTVSFADDVLPILKSRCVNCHGGDRIEEDLSLRSYSDIFAGSKNGAVVVPSDADHSK